MSKLIIGSPMKNHLRMLIYGRRERLDAFLLSQQLIHSTPVWGRYKDKFKRYSLMNNQNIQSNVIQPDIEVLDLEISIRGFTSEDKSQTQHEFLDFLNESLHHDLNWELLWVGDTYKEIFEIRSNQARLMLTFTVPIIDANIDKDQDVPIKFIGER
jgi:hypothetical protein